MPVKAENKSIVVRHPLFEGKTQKEIEMLLFGVENTLFPIRPDYIPPSAWVVGSSLKNIYEKVLKKPCTYMSEIADAHIARELQLHKVVPILVKPCVLEKLNGFRDKGTIFEQKIKQTLNLPIEVVIEK